MVGSGVQGDESSEETYRGLICTVIYHLVEHI